MNLRMTLTLCGILLTSTACDARVRVIAPTEDGLVLGTSVQVIIAGCFGEPDLDARIGETHHELQWQRHAYRGRWLAEVPLPGSGVQELVLEGRCGWQKVRLTRRFDNSVESPVEVAEQVLDRFFAKKSVQGLGWSWGPGVFLYGLGHFAKVSSRAEQHLDWIRAYHRHYRQRGLPKIDAADKCSPALSALMLMDVDGDDAGRDALERVIEYVRTSPRNDLGSLDHLGTDTFFSLFYPSSIWVDSLMMWVLVAAKYAVRAGDEDLEAFAVAQPIIFANKLQDRDAGLFYHAWNVANDQRLPSNNTFWLRGNGWALVFLADLIEDLGPNHADRHALAAIFVDLAQGALVHRLPSAYWDTVLAEPGYAYEESSGSALFAYGFAKGERLGLLGPEFRGYAEETFRAITSRLVRRDPGYTMEDISIGTDPTGRLGYKLVPRDRNLSYGVGALLLLATELVGH